MQIRGLNYRINWGYNHNVVQITLTDSEYARVDTFIVTIKQRYPKYIPTTTRVEFPIIAKDHFYPLDVFFRKYLVENRFEDPLNALDSNSDDLTATNVLNRNITRKSNLSVFSLIFRIKGAKYDDAHYFDYGFIGGALKNILTEQKELYYLTPGIEFVHLDATIPDANFRAYLKKTIPNAFEGELMKINHTDVRNLKRLDISRKKIRTLEGIQFFTGLTYLNCGHNLLTSLDVTKNIALDYLECGHNQIRSLDVSKNVELDQLGCEDNPLTELDLSKNVKLTYLDIRSASIKTLDLSHNCYLNSRNVYADSDVTITWCPSSSSKANKKGKKKRKTVPSKNSSSGVLNTEELIIKLNYKVDYFAGYPLVISFLFCGDNIDALLKRNLGAQYSGYSRMTYQLLNHTTGQEGVKTFYAGINHFNIAEDMLRDNRFTQLSILPLISGAERKRYKIDIIRRVPTTTCGVYLRWLNNLGGWSQFLFESWSENTSLKSAGRFEQFEGRRMVRHELGIERMDVLTVQASNLEFYQKQLIDTLFDSPKIYLYTGVKGEISGLSKDWSSYWAECYISSKKADLMNSETKGYSLSFDLLKPKIFNLHL